MDFSLMETKDLEILLKITEIDIKLVELEIIIIIIIIRFVKRQNVKKTSVALSDRNSRAN